MPLLRVMLHQKFIFCCADFDSTIALDFQHKLNPFQDSCQQQMAMQSFLGILAFSCS